MRCNKKLALPEYIEALLNHPSTEMMAQSKVLGQTRLRISMGRLRELEVPVPPIELQREFLTRARTIRDSQERQRDHLIHLDALFASLQHRAFLGDL
jgi:type I restriction enzyme S subunit